MGRDTAAAAAAGALIKSRNPDAVFAISADQVMGDLPLQATCGFVLASERRSC